jgi:hypothetical protein
VASSRTNDEAEDIYEIKAQVEEVNLKKRSSEAEFITSMSGYEEISQASRLKKRGDQHKKTLIIHALKRDLTAFRQRAGDDRY